MYAMTVHPMPNRRMYWEVHDEDDLFPPLTFGSRFGMSRHRFEDILRYLRLDDQSFAPGGATPDSWLFVRRFVDAFNNNMSSVVFPGQKLCVDESMSSWRGRADYEGGMPHVTKIARKPKGVGLEAEGCM